MINTRKDTYARLKHKLIHRNDIKERIKFIQGTRSDYISENGNVYKDYGDDLWYKKSIYVNKKNGYCYTHIDYIDNPRKRRVHILVAEAFVDNDNPYKNILVGHEDNNKQNNVYTNLYWTTNRENSQKACDDGLNKQDNGIDSETSKQIKVVDLNGNLIAVYGSMRECERMIENIDLAYLTKMISKNGNYTPRNKKYKYISITRDEYLNTEDKYKGLKLYENDKMKKQTRIFNATNLITGITYQSDNQKRFALEHNLNQAQISHCLIHNVNTIEGWKFETVKDIEYTEGSGYNNLINLTDDVLIENVFTGERMTFKTAKECKDYFGLNGHSLDYNNKTHLIESKWKIL